MSEPPKSQPTPPPETPSTSRTAPMKSANAAQTISLNQILAKIQPIVTQAWVSSRPTIAQGLKATIGLLQSATANLEAQIQTDHRSAQPLNLAPLKQAANTFWTKAQPLWAKLIGFSRSRLPADIGAKLSDRTLSGIIAGFALLLLSITTHLPSGSAAPKPQPIVATKPAPRAVSNQPSTTIGQRLPIATAPETTPTFPTALTAPGTPPVPPTTPTVTAKPTTPIASKIPPAPTETTAVGNSLAVAPPIPSPATTANTAPSIVAKSTTPIAPKPIKLTANQKLLAKLQAATGNRPTLLQTIKPNKATSSLQITLNPNWDDLPFAQQDTLAQDLFTQAQTLRFNTLELVNAAGDVVARSPVVGNEMVILLRDAVAN